MLGKLAAIAGFVLLLNMRPADAEAFRLKDGTILYGDVLSRSDSGLSIQTKHLGVVTLDPGNLVCTGAAAVAAASCSSERVWGDPEDRSLLFVPTAFTPPRGTFQFKDVELYFLNLGASPTATTQITGGMLFPITFESQYYTAELKQRLIQWESEESRAAIALNGTLGHPVGDIGRGFPESYSMNMLFSFRTSNHELHFQDGFGLHLLAGNMWSLQDESDYFNEREMKWQSGLSFGAGFEARLTKHVKFIAEYKNAAPYNLFGDNDDFEGFANFGLRIHGAQLSADIAAIRPITSDDLDDLVVLPLLTISYRVGD